MKAAFLEMGAVGEIVTGSCWRSLVILQCSAIETFGELIGAGRFRRAMSPRLSHAVIEA